MKKRLFLFTVATFFCFVSNANCTENIKKMPTNCMHENQEQNEKKNFENNCKNKDISKETYQNNQIPNCKCENDLEDDEYCTYNQCFFDKQYREMKKILCLTRRQENYIDNLYRNFKTDMEKLYETYKCEKNKLLKMIACNEDCFKEQKKNLKEIKNEMKEKTKDFKDEIKDQLCKNQQKDFRKIQRGEKRKIKKLTKYCKVYKFPCVKCCNE